MDSHFIRQGADRSEPDIFFRGSFLRLERIDRVDVADLDGLVAQDLLPDTRGDVVGQFSGGFYLRLQPVGSLDLGHVVLVVETRLVDLERSGHGENGPAFLHGHHPPGGEAFPVPDAVHGVGNRFFGVAGPHEITMQAVGLPSVGNGLGGGGQRLTQHLATEYAAEAQVLALAAEDIFFDFFQFEQFQEFFENVSLDADIHGFFP